MEVDEGRGALRRVIFEYVGLPEIWRGDFVMAILGLAAGVYMSVEHPDAAQRVAPVVAGLVGVVIGAIIAAIALVAAFFDQALLRKLERVNASPQEALAPFLFSVVLGVVASFGVSVVVALGPSVSPWVVGPAAGIAFGAASWTIASLIPALDVLVQFVGVKREAAMLDDDRGD